MSQQEHDPNMDPALDPELDRMSRRRFLGKVGASAAVAAAASAGALGQDKTPGALNDSSLAHENVTFKSGSDTIEGFLCRPKGEGRRPSVIVVQEIFGVNDHIRDIACRLARAGYIGLAVNFFTREGKPPEGFGPPLMEFVGRIADEQVLQDIRSASAYLRSRSDCTGKIGLVGFCWGGYFAMLAAAMPAGADGKMPLDASVAYYGRIRLAPNADRQKKPHAPIEVVEKVRTPLLGHFGALDRGIPVEDVQAYQDELKKRGAVAEIHIYEGANHAFNNDTREMYHAEAAKLAWQRTLDWYARHLK